MTARNARAAAVPTAAPPAHGGARCRAVRCGVVPASSYPTDSRSAPPAHFGARCHAVRCGAASQIKGTGARAWGNVANETMANSPVLI
ncbi:unnamed protein product [Taenia asiatica]|uniref:Secreted protein n=1 Tax=Taenia asiatica TaxID=60517 RepID=A0A0R3WDJ9_TAEAS|nr:unnamed protein product [Taenia asiatica]